MAVPKTYLAADEYLRDQWRLAAEVRRSGWRPDWLVGLWRGGAPAAISVHEFLKVSGWSLRHVPLKCASYDGIGSNDGEVVFTLGDEVFGMFRSGERVLFVDDVFDTGKTVAAVRARMASSGAEAKFAGLCSPMRLKGFPLMSCARRVRFWLDFCAVNGD